MKSALHRQHRLHTCILFHAQIRDPPRLARICRTFIASSATVARSSVTCRTDSTIWRRRNLVFRGNRLPHRTFFSFLPAYFVPPAVFTCIAVAVVVVQCTFLVVYQNRIIYRPAVPPLSRLQKISKYAELCHPIVWREERIKSLDGTSLALCVATNVLQPLTGDDDRTHIVVLYFQGNASSLPPRLPGLSAVLKELSTGPHPVPCTLLALSYRGFWKSAGRPSQPGIEQDAAVAIAFAKDVQDKLGSRTKLVLWGQSIGSGIACTALAQALDRACGSCSPRGDRALHQAALVLETPFVSIRRMLLTLYPQPWLPHRYLWPLLRNWWDSEAALRKIKQYTTSLRILCLMSEKDEVVPLEQSEELVSLCRKLGYQTTNYSVMGARHTEALARRQGRMAVVEFLREVATIP